MDNAKDETTTHNNIILGVTRIQDADGYVGTIHYEGPVASAKSPHEVYVGVIWDDASRGKHDGSVICRSTGQLVRHFSCPNACGASFLKGTKISNSLGVALTCDILQTQYVPLHAPLVAPGGVLQDCFATTKSGKNKVPIELVGETKIRQQQQLDQLHSISLRRMGIARFTYPDDALQEFDHLTEMDLAGNLLSDWETCLAILQQFPNLVQFSVAANRIRDPSPTLMDQVFSKPTEGEEPNQLVSLLEFPTLQVLNVHSCGISSPTTLLWIGSVLPHLQNLCLAHANFSTLTTDMALDASKGLPNLTHLDVSHCQLSSWEHQIVPLAAGLPSLKHFNMDGNPIETTSTTTTTTTDNDMASTCYFPQLESIQITGTQITQWHDLDGLFVDIMGPTTRTTTTSLKQLWFRTCPLLSHMGTGEARAITIARAPATLEKLNGSSISDKERIQAERRYVSSVACQLLQMSNTNAREEFLQTYHKPFESLMEKHRDAIAATMSSSSAMGGIGGPDDPNAPSPRSVAATNNNQHIVVVNVTIQSMAPSSCQQEPLVRRLPGSLPIKRLKALCGRAFGLDPDLQRLHFVTEEDGDLPTSLEDDEHTLLYYGVSDGATIYMNEMDVEELQQQRQQSQQDLETKLKQEEALEMQKQKYKQPLLAPPAPPRTTN